MIKNEFDDLNNVIITSLKQKKKRRYNLPREARNSAARLKKLVADKVIDIRKVDKGQIILVIDHSERIKTEQLNIEQIAIPCEIQESNWQDNRTFVETCAKKNLKRNS